MIYGTNQDSGKKPPVVKMRLQNNSQPRKNQQILTSNSNYNSAAQIVNKMIPAQQHEIAKYQSHNNIRGSSQEMVNPPSNVGSMALGQQAIQTQKINISEIMSPIQNMNLNTKKKKSNKVGYK